MSNFLRFQAEKNLKLKKIDPADTGKIKNQEEVADEMTKFQKELFDLHYLMYADNRRSLLVILQGIDASGKDGAVRFLAGGLNPMGTKIYSFKKPSELELDHDYFWRIHNACPNRGDVAIFNRSHYEEVAVVKVHPEYLSNQSLPTEIAGSDKIWEQRYRQIRDFEQMLAENGTVIVKFLLHISKEKQQERFEERLSDPRKHWKFQQGDLVERNFWDDYMKAFEEMINETNTKCAPWYVIPADRKWYRNYLIGGIVVETLGKLEMEFPKLAP